MTDADPKVIDLLLKNPNLSIAEVRTLAGRRNVTRRHLEFIAQNTTWMADDQVRVVIARSPKIPDHLAPGILRPLPTAVLRQIALEPNTAVTRAARRSRSSRNAASRSRRRSGTGARSRPFAAL
jgi:hypothetical protein